jgi:AraC family transcriptional regulator of arabinose operon
MRFPAGAQFGPRKQAAYEIIAPHAGGLVIEIDSVPLDLPPDAVTLLRPGLRCVFRFDDRAETLVKYVSATDPALPISLLGLLDAPAFSLPASSAMRGLLDTILELATQPVLPVSAVASLIASSVALYVEEALAAGRIRGADPAGREHPAITAVREVVRQNLAEPLTLRDLATAAHVAPEHLVRVFRRYLGTTPMRFLWSARVRLGIHLLGHSHLPVGEIAARVGCLSPKHFARLIRAEVGAPPREVRRRSWSYAAPLAPPLTPPPAPPPAPPSAPAVRTPLAA